MDKKSPISENLYKFLKDWRDTPMKNKDIYGLCRLFKVWLYSRGNVEATIVDELSRLACLFEDDGLDDHLPFNSRSDGMPSFMNETSKHLNPMRRAWVDRTIKRYENWQDESECLISPLLYEFLVEWNTGRIPGAKTNGLCVLFTDWLRKRRLGGHVMEEKEKLARAFGWDTYPFNKDAIEYEYEYDRRANPKRMAWVLQAIKDYEEHYAVL